MYKLAENGVIKDGSLFIPDDPANRHWQEYLAWLAAGNTPEPMEQPAAEEAAHLAEIEAAPLTAREYFLAHPAAIAFIRLTPAEQETQIEAMTLAQVKGVVRYLTIAVSALVRREFL